MVGKMSSLDKLTTLKLALEPTDGIAKDKLFGLGLGAQRCGSTWIGKYLSNHPEFYISSTKEMHIFDALSKQREHPLLRKFNKNKAFKLQPNQQDILKIYEQISQPTRKPVQNWDFQDNLLLSQCCIVVGVIWPTQQTN